MFVLTLLYRALFEVLISTTDYRDSGACIYEHCNKLNEI